MDVVSYTFHPMFWYLWWVVGFDVMYDLSFRDLCLYLAKVAHEVPCENYWSCRFEHSWHHSLFPWVCIAIALARGQYSCSHFYYYYYYCYCLYF